MSLSDEGWHFLEVSEEEGTGDLLYDWWHPDCPKSTTLTPRTVDTSGNLLYEAGYYQTNLCAINHSIEYGGLSDLGCGPGLYRIRSVTEPIHGPTWTEYDTHWEIIPIGDTNETV